MANFLPQFQAIKSSCDHLIIAVEDVSDLWPTVKDGFEGRLPFKIASLNNKTCNTIVVENLPAEFILTTDQRLRSRFPRENPLFSFREPYATCEESLAFMFEIAHLHEDALHEYDELELCYIETVNMTGKQREFGGVHHGDDQAAMINPGNIQLSEIVQDDLFREFEFKQYLFACQERGFAHRLHQLLSTTNISCNGLGLLFKLNRPFEVASQGYSFIISFSKSLALRENILPFCLREVWIVTACLGLIKATDSHYSEGLVAPDLEKEFYRLLADLYSLCRVKFMRLAYLIGYGTEIVGSPLNR